MNEEQKAVHFETQEHIQKVSDYILRFVSLLINAAKIHDKSKLESPEMESFAVATPKLKGLMYGSDEYRATLREIKPAIEHHYKNNSHHPEYFKNGVADMNLLEIVEMFCDWNAAAKRHDNGDIFRSLDINQDRFKITSQLISTFKNTVAILEGT